MSLIVPFAHAGHVLIDLPVFLGPVLVIALWLLVMLRRGRRSTQRSAAAAGARTPGGSSRSHDP